MFASIYHAYCNGPVNKLLIGSKYRKQVLRMVYCKVQLLQYIQDWLRVITESLLLWQNALRISIEVITLKSKADIAGRSSTPNNDQYTLHSTLTSSPYIESGLQGFTDTKMSAIAVYEKSNRPHKLLQQAREQASKKCVTAAQPN